MSEILRDIMS